MMIERQTISIMKACELVGVSRRTIYNWIASGKVEYVRTAGGSIRIFVDTLWRQPGKEPDLTRNQLGIILANAELLEIKSADEMGRARASQVVASVLEAMVTAKEIRLRTRASPLPDC